MTGKICCALTCLHLIFLAFIALPPLKAQQPQVNRSRSFGPDACGPADPTYIRNAEATGGLPLFLQRSEAAKAFHLVRESTKQNVATVLWATDSLADGEREFDVPVDSTVHSVTFALSVDSKGSAMSVLRPSGEEVIGGPANVEVTELNCGRFVTVNSPEAGDWKLRLSGTGRFWLQAEATSEIFFVTAEFVEVGGRIGHEGYFRIAGQPLAGQPATLQVNLSGAGNSMQFHLVSGAGERIMPVPMKLESSYGEDKEWMGVLDLPSQPFRVAVSGTDSTGHRFQRFYSSLFRAQTVSLSHLGGVQDLAPGRTTTLTFTVHNTGEAATFRIVVWDSRNFATRTEPAELSLAQDASGTVSVDLTVPAGVPPGTSDTFTITATSTTSPEISNSDVEELSVFTPHEPGAPQ